MYVRTGSDDKDLPRLHFNNSDGDLERNERRWEGGNGGISNGDDPTEEKRKGEDEGLEGGGSGSDEPSPSPLFLKNPDGGKEGDDWHMEGERRKGERKGGNNSENRRDSTPSSTPSDDSERSRGQGVGNGFRKRPQYPLSFQDSQDTDIDRESIHYRPMPKENRRKTWRYGDNYDLRPYSQKQYHANSIKSRRHLYRYNDAQKGFPSDGRWKASLFLSKLGMTEDQLRRMS